MTPPALPSVVAGVVATGPFRRTLVPFLDYGASFYEHTREGTRILVTLMFDLHDPVQLRDAGQCLGVDPWDFNTHVIDPARVDLEGLGIVWEDDGLPDRFTALKDAGFQFLFRMEPSRLAPTSP
ncbi:hypothetical protein JYK02_13330 [Corallococcus macrosporus]|uniref:Uncharacterized protein n=1 Tax=Corallococcus macrosporus TaxID=35 RepID=A0ABS3DA18_9BACT|nr:hypothetical protein [Corallococcus macrosporus]MBN8228487.1 hypothetical protein [Corallococcus macrosporus]